MGCTSFLGNLMLHLPDSIHFMIDVMARHTGLQKDRRIASICEDTLLFQQAHAMLMQQDSAAHTPEGNTKHVCQAALQHSRQCFTLVQKGSAVQPALIAQQAVQARHPGVHSIVVKFMAVLSVQYGSSEQEGRSLWAQGSAQDDS